MKTKRILTLVLAVLCAAGMWASSFSVTLDGLTTDGYKFKITRSGGSTEETIYYRTVS